MIPSRQIALMTQNRYGLTVKGITETTLIRRQRERQGESVRQREPELERDILTDRQREREIEMEGERTITSYLLACLSL